MEFWQLLAGSQGVPASAGSCGQQGAPPARPAPGRLAGAPPEPGWDGCGGRRRESLPPLQLLSGLPSRHLSVPPLPCPAPSLAPGPVTRALSACVLALGSDFAEGHGATQGGSRRGQRSHGGRPCASRATLERVTPSWLHRLQPPRNVLTRSLNAPGNSDGEAVWLC